MAIRFAYSRPSPSHYPWQWYWDSCFHAIVWRRFDAIRAESELRSLLDGGRGDGFIGHTIFWDRPVDWQRRWTYNVTSRSAPNTSTIQPPLLAWAWRIAVGDPAEEPGSPPTTAGSRGTGTSTATACSGSSSRTSRASTPRRSSTPSGACAPMPACSSPS